MSRRRRIIFYACLFLVAGGLLFWQWWTRPLRGGEPLSTWLGRVNDPDPTVRAKTATALGELGGESDQAWNELATMSLYDDDDETREEAIKRLKTLCHSHVNKEQPKRIERKRRVLQSLLDGFKIGNVEVRRRIPEVVYDVIGLDFHERGIRRETDDAVDGEMRPAAVLALIAAFKDADEEVQEEAVRYLGKLATIPIEAEPGLLEQLRSNNAVTRCGAADALIKLQHISDAAIPGLIAAVQDDSPNVRRSAFFCVIRVGPKATPALKEAMTKASEKARGYLETCLKALDLAKAG